MHTWNHDILQAGRLRLDGGGMFGIIPKSMWSGWTSPDDDNRIDLQTNCLLLRRNDRTVLIETGCGDKWSPRERDMYGLESRTVVDALGERGVAPDDVDLVIVTHLHFDHAGGLTRIDDDGGRVVPVFPRAEIVVQGVEWEDAVANRSTMTRTYLRNHLDPIAGQFRCVDGEIEVLPGIQIVSVPGHTRGQQGVLIDGVDGRLAFLGDLLPTIHHAHPSAATAYDMDPYETHQTKMRMLERAEEEDWIVVLDHEPDEPVVRVRRDDRGRRSLTPRSDP